MQNAIDPVISISTVYNNFEVLNRYLYPSIRALRYPINRFELDNTNNNVTTNIASLYNVFLRLYGPELIAFLHPDISFEDSFIDDLLAARDTLERAGKRWGAMGIVGRTWEGEYVWCHEVKEPTLVCCLDSCSLITNKTLGIRFDQKRFNEFHCYVEDYCLQCHQKDFGVFVFPTRASHGSATKSIKGSQWGKYNGYRRRLRLKWWPKFRTIYSC